MVVLNCVSSIQFIVSNPKFTRNMGLLTFFRRRTPSTGGRVVAGCTLSANLRQCRYSDVMGCKGFVRLPVVTWNDLTSLRDKYPDNHLYISRTTAGVGWTVRSSPNENENVPSTKATGSIDNWISLNGLSTCKPEAVDSDDRLQCRSTRIPPDFRLAVASLWALESSIIDISFDDSRSMCTILSLKEGRSQAPSPPVTRSGRPKYNMPTTSQFLAAARK